jgi:hypothetical protein
VVCALLAGVTVATSPPAHAATGTSFWLTFPTNFDNGVASPLVLTLSIASSGAAASGTVAIPGLGSSQAFTVPAGGVTTVTVPNGAVVGAPVNQDVVVQDLGIQVTADAPVSVTGLSHIVESTDAYLGLPVSVLGTDYRAVSYTTILDDFSELAIVSTVDGTQVTVTPTANLADGTAAGTPLVQTVNAGEVLFVPSVDGGDLTGSQITATQPVAVFSGTRCTIVPSNSFACNHLLEQLPPTTSWGSQFVTVPLATRTGGDRFRMIASTAATVVSVNGTAVATLDAGEFLEQVIGASALITSSSPIMLVQYSQGSSVDGVAADPSMAIVPPTSAFQAAYTFLAQSGFNSFVNVVVPTATIGSLTLDGAAVSVGSFTSIPGTTYSGAQLALTPGPHRLAGSSPFGAIVYGFATADSYLHAAGANLPQAPPPPTTTLTLAPPTQSRTVGQQACVDATLLEGTNPVPGSQIGFSVSGANTATGTATTGSNGVAQFCYTGSNAGDDTVTASSGLLVATSTVTWTAVGPNPPPTVNAGADATTTEGSSVPLAGTASDSDPLTTAWTAAPGAGVDAGASCSFGNASAPSTTVTCNDDGVWTITLTASDGVNPPVSDSLTLTVGNAPPAVTIGAPADMSVVDRGATVALSAAVADPGTHDVLTCTIDWGDGSPPATSPANGSCTGQHAYGTAGTFTITVTVRDDDLGQAAASVRVVVQDAPSTSSKVAGAGIIGTEHGKAGFAFFARADGAGHLSGKLTLVSRRGFFVGTTVTSLSVNTPDATWTGTGFWNGKGGYTFTASITDGETKAHPRGVDTASFIVRDRHGVVVFQGSGPVKLGDVTIEAPAPPRHERDGEEDEPRHRAERDRHHRAQAEARQGEHRRHRD